MSADNLDTLLGQFQKYQGKGLLVDTNLLLLYLVGLTNRNRISTFKPITNQGFTTQDFNLLESFISRFRTIATTPHILTEISNHSEKLKGQDQQKFCAILRTLIGGWDERCPVSAILCKQDHFPSLGLTDTAIGEIAPDNFLVLTVDFELTGHLQKRKVDVLNFNHLRLRNLP